MHSISSKTIPNDISTSIHDKADSKELYELREREKFFQILDMIGYIPVVGSVVGLSRIISAFAMRLFSKQAEAIWRANQEMIRGAVELFPTMTIWTDVYAMRNPETLKVMAYGKYYLVKKEEEHITSFCCWDKTQGEHIQTKLKTMAFLKEIQDLKILETNSYTEIHENLNGFYPQSFCFMPQKIYKKGNFYENILSSGSISRSVAYSHDVRINFSISGEKFIILKDQPVEILDGRGSIEMNNTFYNQVTVKIEGDFSKGKLIGNGTLHLIDSSPETKKTYGHCIDEKKEYSREEIIEKAQPYFDAFKINFKEEPDFPINFNLNQMI